MENLGICKGQGNILSSLKVGPSLLQLSKIGKEFYSLLNNRVVAAYKAEKDLVAKGLPFIVSLVKEMCKEACTDQVESHHSTGNKMLSDAMKYVKNNLRPAEIFVLELVPDEIQDQLPKQAAVRKPILPGLQNYRNSLKELEATVNCLRGSSEILLKTKLAKQMWGSKDVMQVIHANKTAMTVISQDYEKADMCFEKSGDRAKIVTAAFERRMATQHTKEVVGNMIEDFSFLKSFMSKMAQELQPLYTIDQDFKASTGYPATWFLNASTFMDFTDSYDNLIKHIIKFASLESEVFEPLLLWKMTGVAKS